MGEWATATIGVGEANRIELLEEIRFPHSLGMLYSAFTYYTGFKVNSGEYKVMGLAPTASEVWNSLRPPARSRDGSLANRLLQYVPASP